MMKESNELEKYKYWVFTFRLKYIFLYLLHVVHRPCSILFVQSLTSAPLTLSLIPCFKILFVFTEIILYLGYNSRLTFDPK